VEYPAQGRETKRQSSFPLCSPCNRNGSDYDHADARHTNDCVIIGYARIVRVITWCVRIGARFAGMQRERVWPCTRSRRPIENIELGVISSLRIDCGEFVRRSGREGCECGGRRETERGRGERRANGERLKCNEVKKNTVKKNDLIYLQKNKAVRRCVARLRRDNGRS